MHTFPMRMRSARATLALFVALASAACTMPFRNPVYADRTNRASDDISFTGVVGEIDRQYGLDVILVHGMCTHDGAWANEAIASMTTKLHGTLPTTAILPHSVPDTDMQLYQRTIDTKKGPVRVNAIVWSRVTTQLKRQLCYDQTKKIQSSAGTNAYCERPNEVATYPYERAGTLNVLLKDSILDDCLADAVIYEGQSRDEINVQMQKAIIQALGTSGSDSDVSTLASDPQQMLKAVENRKEPRLIVITDSLGSKIAFDALFKLKYNPATKTAAQVTLDRTAYVFMRANQLPILGLGDQKVALKQTGKDSVKNIFNQGVSNVPPQEYPRDPLAELFKSKSTFSEGTTIKGIVAFTDPDDLLSYILVPSDDPALQGVPVIDGIVSTEPTYLGLVERPDRAHLRYPTNPHVTEAIVCGKPKSGDCD